MSKMYIELIVFYVLLVDSAIANVIAWLGKAWYAERFRTLSRYFPMTKAWAGLYLGLVLLIGYLVMN